MKKLALATTVFLGLAGPALASQCPGLMAKIDEALLTVNVDDATLATITELRATGQAAHESGDHAASEAALLQALQLMGM